MTPVCVCSSLLSEEAVHTLNQRFRVVLMPPDNDLPEPIRCHPDSIFAVVGEQLIFPRSYAESYPGIVEEISSLSGLRLILSDASRGSVYPLDASLNAACGRDFLLCRPDIAAPEILSAAEQQNLTVIPVRQGYAGCACLMTDRAVLTFDSGIARVLESRPPPCVLLDSGGISLHGYDCGFFGGACGFFDDTVFINGNPESLPCYPQLREFAKNCGYTLFPLCQSPVTDCGGIRIFGK
ncbi:MAG: hypothetical protein IJF78_13385 [Clostridia bacterium]|nr:hypothetical protein [Clostridia bacterium]